MAHAFQKRERRKFTVEEYLHLEEADELRPEDVLALPSIELQISLKDLYARVDWE
jgi:hypothetical protein